MIAAESPDADELVALYESVGWSAYTRDRATLVAAVGASYCVLTARSDAGDLIGLLRAISDGHTIAYVQDILVSPAHHRRGIGGALLDDFVARVPQIRQVVLITDAEPGQRAFYESRGFVEAHDVAPEPLRSFVRLR